MTTQVKRGIPLSPALRAIRDALATPHGDCLLGMRKDWNNIRQFLPGGIIDGRMGPAGSFNVNCDGQFLVIRLSIYALEIEAKYQGTEWDSLWEKIELDLGTGEVTGGVAWKGKQRLSRGVDLS